MFWIAIIIFVISLLFFIFDWADKTLVALAGAAILVIANVLTWHEAVNAIDFETIALLLGLMILVAAAQHSGIFEWLNAKIAQKSGGSPLMVFVLFILFTFLASTILNNATVVLLIIPIAIALSKGLGLNSKLLVILVAIFSNIGGAMTLIGDPPNTIVGVQVGLSFMDFLKNLTIPVLVMSVFVVLYTIGVYWQDLKPISKNFSKLFISNLIIKRIEYQYASKSINKYVVASTIFVLLATVISFIVQPFLGISVGLLGICSGVLIAFLLTKHQHFMHMLKEVEWDSLLFFSALFVQVGALEKVGFLEMITNFIVSFSDNYALLLMIIVWGLGIASSVINNIPFVALMIPVIFDLQARMTGQPDLDLLWWALCLGACLGGNATMVGSSSGLLAVEMARKKGVNVSFFEFMKVGVPITLISLTVSSVYLLARLYL